MNVVIRSLLFVKKVMSEEIAFGHGSCYFETVTSQIARSIACSSTCDVTSCSYITANYALLLGNRNEFWLQKQ